MFRGIAPLAVACLAFIISGCAPSQSDIEDSIRNEMKSSLNVEITSTNLTKQPDGSYIGTANAANGDVYEVTTSVPKQGRVEWKAIPSQQMVERLVRTGMEEKLPVKVKSLTLNKESPGHYTGTAELVDGTKLKVTTKMEGKDLIWEFEPLL